MAYPGRSQREVISPILPVATAALAIAIFVADTLTPIGVAVAGLYVAVVLLAARFCRRRDVVLVAAGCAFLTLVSQLLWRPNGPGAEGAVNALTSIAAIAVTAFLALQGQAAEAALRDQASLLDLTHDTVFVRGMDDVITYWNRGAEDLYGWSAGEAVGKVSHQLMQTRFPGPLDEINAELLRTGRWEGELVHTKRDATQVTVSSRWSLQRDAQGRPAMILETNNDITERKQAEYLTGQVFVSSPDWLCIIGRDYRYQRVNPVYARVWGMPVEGIIGKHVADVVGTDHFEQPVKPALDRCLAGEDVNMSGWAPTHLLGRRLYVSVSYLPLRRQSERVEAVLAITRELTDFMLASEGLRAAQSDLAHVNRVATMGQLTASIAHEVNQPIAAAMINAQAALRWLGTQPPDLGEVRQALGRVIDNGGRASAVIGRIRGVIAKAPPRTSRFDLNEAVSDVIALTQSEALKQGVSVQTQLATDLPSVEGDRVRLQQVILNLIMNAIEAMSGADAPRELRLATETDAAGGVRVTVRDSGPGLDPEGQARVFEAFYTTKAEGMGMGLAICRSIVEEHGGRLWASANEPRGAVFQLTLPAERAEAAPPEYADPMPV